MIYEMAYSYFAWNITTIERMMDGQQYCLPTHYIDVIIYHILLYKYRKLSENMLWRFQHL